jgi:glyoxylase-like metal-dependent hydrolase (beta-lactamase superfamily II)
MILLSHFPTVGISNTYLIGPDNGGPAILVDPGQFDVTLLDMIEGNRLDINAVLVTHGHENHVKGLRTLRKIYQAEVYYGGDRVMEFPAKRVEDGDIIDICGFETEVISVGGHSADSRLYRIDGYLFSGDILSAGRIGTSGSTWGRANMIEDLKIRIFSRKENYIVLPGHGPPTTLDAERQTNTALVGEL